MNSITPCAMSATSDIHLHRRVNAVVVSRSDIFNAGLRTLLHENMIMNAIFTFSEPEQLVLASAGIQQRIDLVIVDEDSQPGRSLPLHWICSLKGFEDAAIVAAATAYRANDVADMFRRGARACVCKNMSVSLFTQALGSALRHEWWVAEEYRERFSIKMRHQSRPPVLPEAGLYNSLTPAEQEVVKKLLAGMTPTKIADTTGKSIKTISGQKMSAMRKLDVRSIAELHTLLSGLIN